MREQLEAIILETKILEKAYADELAKIHPNYTGSAKNLVHYMALRRHDLRYLQKNLRNYGLSRLAKAERHVMASLVHSMSYLEALEQGQLNPPIDHELSIKEGTKKLNQHSKALLGKRAAGRNVRIMVTLPSNAAQDPDVTAQLVAAGMDTARINCAHDQASDWMSMIHHLKEACRQQKRKVSISMDLGGPKIRTGPISPGPQIMRLKPPKDLWGNVVDSLRVPILTAQAPPYTGPHIRIEQALYDALTSHSEIKLRDARNKKRKILVERNSETEIWGLIEATTYLTSGLLCSYQGIEHRLGHFPPLEGIINLKQGDILMVHGHEIEGTNAQQTSDGSVQPAQISCTNQQVFVDVKPGERVFFDDGKIAGEILDVTEALMKVQITSASEKVQNLKSDKGINFPDSHLTLSGLTEKDRQDLAFVAQHADVVNFSFVNCAQDVFDLFQALKQLEAPEDLGIILKIETQRGFTNLSEILLAAMQHFPVGVMIARGDLAIECGWENLGALQEEILRLCEAAHIPDIWATQVLENLAKKGIPSRAEITDASMGQRAECIMLNKGPFILDTIALLHSILKNMKSYQDKKDVILPILDQSSKTSSQ